MAAGRSRCCRGRIGVLLRSAFVGNVAQTSGGAVYASGTASASTALEVVDCDFQANESLGPARGRSSPDPPRLVHVRNSSFWDNRSAALGGALYVNRGELIVESSTVSGNVANSSGGGIAAATASGSATLRVLDSTVTVNESDADGSGTGDGGGIAFLINAGDPAMLELRNSIVAGNVDGGGTSWPDVSIPTGLTVAGGGWNLIGANDGASAYFAAGFPNAAGDFVGTAASPIDPLLEALDYNAEGFTATHRPVLSAASPVIDQGACPGRSSDQLGRGAAGTGLRIVPHPAVVDHAASDGCDIGAFERGADLNVVSFCSPTASSSATPCAGEPKRLSPNGGGAARDVADAAGESSDLLRLAQAREGGGHRAQTGRLLGLLHVGLVVALRAFEGLALESEEIRFLRASTWAIWSVTFLPTP